MATISYLLVGTKPTRKIYCRLIVKRGEVFQCATKYTLHKDDWSKAKKRPKQGDEERKVLNDNLDTLSKNIINRYDEDTTQGVKINKDWLSLQVSTNGIKPIVEQKKHYLDDAFETYITTPPIRKTTSKPRSLATVTKYRTLQGKIKDYQKEIGQRLLVKDVNITFRDDFFRFLTTHKDQKLSSNTAGRYLSFVKTICLDAQMRGAEVHHQLSAVTGSEEPAHKIFLSFTEIEQINKTTFEREALENAKDWLVIGCYIGQRVSDLLPLTKENIVNKNGLDLIELTQKKTGKTVLIPIVESVQQVLDKRGGEFPRTLSSTKFNLHIKDVAKEAGLTQVIEGAKIVTQTNEKTKKSISRKEVGMFSKWELVTSHICRRSFATNYYGEMITSLIIQITGHATERQFLEYVGKPPIDNAQQIAEYFTTIYNTEKAKREKKGMLQVRKAE